MSEDGKTWAVVMAGLVSIAVLWGTFATIQAYMREQAAERIAHEKTVQNCLWQHRTPAECGVIR